MKFKQIIGILFFSGLFFNLISSSSVSSSPASRGYSDDLFMHLDDKLSIAQEDFEEMYKDLLDQDFFLEEDKDLALRSAINKDFLETGPVLLNLIEWLQKNDQNIPDAQFLLNKLDRYFYFVFRNFISEIDVDKEVKGELYRLSHDLYKFKVPNNKSNADPALKPFAYPFRTTLSKAIIFVLIVTTSSLPYNEKVKHFVYYFDKIKRELFEIKKTLINCSFKDGDIDKFIELLQVYSISEPFFMIKHFKFMFKAMAVIFACTTVVVLVIYFSLPYLIEPVREYSDGLAKKLETAVAKTEEYKDSFLDSVENHWYTRWTVGWFVGPRDKSKKNGEMFNQEVSADFGNAETQQPEANKREAASSALPNRENGASTANQNVWGKAGTRLRSMYQGAKRWLSEVDVANVQIPDSII